MSEKISQSVGLVEKGKEGLKNTAKALATLAVISGTSVQANDLLTQCDFNKNGKIDTRKTYKIDGVPRNIAKKETKCSLKFENAQLDKENAQGRIVLAQLDMTIKNLKEELRIVEEKLKDSKEGLKDSKEGLKESKKEREKKRQWLIEQIKKIKENAQKNS